MTLEGTGFNVIDIEINVKPQGFVEAVKQYRPQILAMSALLTTTMIKMEDTISASIEAGIRHEVKVAVGGAPLTENSAKQIRADGYCSNAQTGTEKAVELFTGVKEQLM